MPLNVVFCNHESAKSNLFSREYRTAVTRFIAGLEGIVEIDRRVDVLILPAAFLTSDHKNFADGHCYHFTNPIVIHIAGLCGKGLEDVYHTICHEIVHVEQARDGRKITERGVKVRARNLVRKVLERM